jgi:hypothetical protein
MDFFSSGSEGVTGLCRWQLRRARSQFLFQSTKISSQEHWLQSFGKANWIVLYFSDSSSLGAPKAGALPETHHNFGGRRSVVAFSPFGLPCGRQPSQRPLARVRVNPPPRALLFILSKNPYSDSRWSANFPLRIRNLFTIPPHASISPCIGKVSSSPDLSGIFLISMDISVY